MNDQTIVALFALVGVLITAGFGLLGAVLAARSKANSELIDDLRAEVDRHAVRLERVETTNRLLVDYAEQLRQHIADGNPPPPPAWPAGLNR